ncbi:MAG TPA: DNA primase small subunit PriS [Candidatus Thermoplasmatota archaeon]|nr:DNA primase small subunit PriS [Candidatus Thermoplasmatota archaeon]
MAAPGGPPPQERIDATLAWVTERFRDAYAAAPPEPPARFGRREFGFLWNGKKFFLRHLGFSSREAFQEFMAREAPHHAYYSTAYYKTPHAPTMKEKEWLGADLIFDLDADHLPDAAKLSFAEQLARVKVEARKLLHEFLLGDFGFEAEHVRIVFSGGRGYHFHVTDPRVHAMDAAARREVVDYLSPNDTVATSLYEGWAFEKAKKRDKYGNVQRAKEVPPASAPGWNGRITKAVAAYLTDVASMEPRAASRKLQELDGVGPKTAETIVAHLTPERIARIRDLGLLEQFDALAREPVVKALVREAKVLSEGETDEPVTADVKRLIRLPGSLHGKTGLRVTPLSVDEFDRFDPLRDAVAFSDAPARVVVSKPTEVPLLGKPFTAQPGEQELPLYAAMFVVLRRAALLPA